MQKKTLSNCQATLQEERLVTFCASNSLWILFAYKSQFFLVGKMMIRELEIREYIVAALPAGGAREGCQQF